MFHETFSTQNTHYIFSGHFLVFVVATKIQERPNICVRLIAVLPFTFSLNIYTAQRVPALKLDRL